jgi:glycosyltransferase involved in cell wall biosynthesis
MKPSEPLRFASNLERFPRQWEVRGIRGTSLYCPDWNSFRQALASTDLLIVNCDPALTFRLGLYFHLFPWLRKPALAVDLVLPVPKGAGGFLKALGKRFCLQGIPHFVHHFRDLRGYERYYGIDPARSSYLSFKVNLPIPESPDSEGSYVLCIGRSERDYDSFFACMEQLPSIPAAIPAPDPAQLAVHGSLFSRSPDHLPANVRILPDDGDSESQIRMLQGARIVALPLLRDRIKASGISVYLNAMAMEKCVITNTGPGTSDVLQGEAVLIEPGDPSSLAAAIARIWNDDAERRAVARKGRAYAVNCGQEADCYRRILERAVEFMQSR